MFKKTILPIILTTFLTAVFNRIFAGSWFSWPAFVLSKASSTIHSTPLYLLILAGVGIFFFGLLLYHRKREKELNARSPITFLSYPVNGYRELGYHEHLGVKWLLRLPNPSPFNFLEQEDPSRKAFAFSQDLNIRGPFCPNCQTELTESARFLGGYSWSCDMCAMSKTSEISMSKAQEKAEKVFQSQLRRQLNNGK